MLQKLGIPLLGNNKKVLLMRGIFGTTALLMFFYTLQNIPLASAVTLQYLSPIFTALFAAIFLKEKMQIRQWLYFGISFAGVALIKGFDERISDLYAHGHLLRHVLGMAYTCIRQLKDGTPCGGVVFPFGGYTHYVDNILFELGDAPRRRLALPPPHGTV